MRAKRTLAVRRQERKVRRTTPPAPEGMPLDQALQVMVEIATSLDDLNEREKEAVKVVEAHL